MRADFINLPAEPFPPERIPDFDHDGPDRFFNREISWLAFNWRVLEEAENRNNPLLERVRFLSISGGNLDEFYMVRVAGLRGQVRSGVTKPSMDGRSPSEQLALIDEDARRLMRAQDRIWGAMRNELADARIEIVSLGDLDESDDAMIEALFLDQIFPVLSPLAVDPAHPFPFIPNLGHVLAMTLRREGEEEEMSALVPIPSQLDRFIPLEIRDDVRRYLPLEDLLAAHLDKIMPGYAPTGSCQFRVLREIRHLAMLRFRRPSVFGSRHQKDRARKIGKNLGCVGTGQQGVDLAFMHIRPGGEAGAECPDFHFELIPLSADRAHHSASSPCSPVRTRMACSRFVTKILPSPIFPVRAVDEIASTILSTSSSDAAISRRILGTKFTTYSAPR